MSGTTSLTGCGSPSLVESAAAPAGLNRRALIDLDALAANLARTTPEFFDARADAFGHGISLVGPTVHASGIGAIVVSDARDADRARAAGFDDIRIDRRPEGGDAEATYGVDGESRPVMTLVGEVLAVKRVGADAGVSYGYTHRTEGPTNLALIGLGYADGVPRLASNRALVKVAGSQHPLVGRIAMDQFVVSCGDDSPDVGADAVLFGDAARDEPTALQWAAWTERSALALTAGLGQRIRRAVR